MAIEDEPWGWKPEEIEELSAKGERVGAVLGLLAVPDRDNSEGHPIPIEAGAVFVRFSAFDMALGPELPETRLLGVEVFDYMGDSITTFAVTYDDLFRGVDLGRPA